jgi:hypothetical protein
MGACFTNFDIQTPNTSHLKTHGIWAIFTSQLILRLKFKCYEKV